MLKQSAEVRLRRRKGTQPDISFAAPSEANGFSFTNLVDSIEMSTNYVLCTWSGHRRIPDSRREQEPEFYLKSHIEWLSIVGHSLDQITVVVPYNPDEPPSFRSYLNSLPKSMSGARVRVFERPNIGLSYGSLSDVYKEYRLEYDYYMFAEDDYVFMQHDFDTLHVRLMEEDSRCAYVCGMAWGIRDMPYHAGVAVGLMRASALEKVFLKYGKLPHAADSTYISNQREGQIGQSRALIEEGYTLKDWGGRYRVGYRKGDFSVNYFHEDCKDVMVMPV